MLFTKVCLCYQKRVRTTWLDRLLLYQASSQGGPDSSKEPPQMAKKVQKGPLFVEKHQNKVTFH